MFKLWVSLFESSAINSLVGKSARNSAEFRYYSDSGPFPCQNFDQNFVFPIIKLVPANLEHGILSAINSSEFIHWKKFPSFFILPAKITSTRFPSKTSRCNFGGMIIFPTKITSTCFE
jgi:hypothetical protein